MTIYDLLVEAVERAEAAGRTHDHCCVLVLVDQANPHKRLTWTLAEARAEIEMVMN